jgi:hypothetical protein
MPGTFAVCNSILLLIIQRCNENSKELLLSYFSIPYSIGTATYSAPIDGSAPINIVDPFIDVPHRFFHCNKELHYSAFFVYWQTYFEDKC